MQWEQIVNAVKDFLNQPIPIIGFTIGFVLVSILTIFAKTSIGRKSIKKMMSALNEVKLNLTSTIDGTKKQVEELKSEYEEKLKIAETHSTEVENLLLQVADQLHNAKIREYVEEYRQAKNDTKVQVANIVEKSSEEINLKVEEVKKEFEAYKQELKEEYEKMMNEYKEQLAKLKEEQPKIVEVIENVPHD